MVRCTSKAAFIDNEKTGFNSTKRAQIFNYILEHPGCSRGDIERGLEMKINCVTGRVNELLESGLIREEGCKHDSVSGRSVNCLMITKPEFLLIDCKQQLETGKHA